MRKGECRIWDGITEGRGQGTLCFRMGLFYALAGVQHMIDTAGLHVARVRCFYVVF
jgi:hypothetical protein